MAKKYYKVVNPDMTSCCLHPSFPSKFRVTYKVGQWTKPKIDGTRLFIFSSLDAAKNFRYNQQYPYPTWDIYECEVNNARRDKVANVDKIENYWKTILNARKLKKRFLDLIEDFLMNNTPNNTYSATEVKLLKRVA